MSVKQYKIVEVNGAYKHGRYDKIWLKSISVMSNVEFLTPKMAGQRSFSQPAGQTNTIHYIHPYDTQMHQKRHHDLSGHRGNVVCKEGRKVLQITDE